MKLYLIFAFAAILVTLASAKNINPDQRNNEELAEEVGKIEENYAALEKEQEEGVKEVERQFDQQEKEQEEVVANIEDKITELEEDDKDAVEEIEEKIAQLEEEEIVDAAKKVAKEWEKKQKEFEDTRAILNLPSIKLQIIDRDRRYSPAKPLEIYSAEKNIRPDGSLKNLTATYKLKCDGFKKRECEKCTIKVSFNEHANLFHAKVDVTSFKCKTYN